MKSLPFYISEAWKRYPFRREPPRIDHYIGSTPWALLPLCTLLPLLAENTFWHHRHINILGLKFPFLCQTKSQFLYQFAPVDDFFMLDASPLHVQCINSVLTATAVVKEKLDSTVKHYSLEWRGYCDISIRIQQEMFLRGCSLARTFAAFDCHHWKPHLKGPCVHDGFDIHFCFLGCTIENTGS